jgi:fluoroquinolone resistance protein
MDEHFNKLDFASNPLPKGEYENCTFANCDFSNQNLSGFVFSDCNFKGCNLSLAAVKATAFREVMFVDCKLTGIQFHTCNDFLFSVSFENCILNLASFNHLKIKKSLFKKSTLQEVDFTEADCTNSTFDGCDLSRTIFYRTNLEKCDFRTSFNYSIDPETNKIKHAKFSLNGIMGLLEKYAIDVE